MHDVITSAAAHLVVSVAALQQVVAGVAVNPIVTSAAIDGVRPVLANQNVIVIATMHLVVT